VSSLGRQKPMDPKKGPLNEDYHYHILAGIDPKKDREQRRQSREWYKKKYGGSEDALDKAFGTDSRKNYWGG